MIKHKNKTPFNPRVSKRPPWVMSSSKSACLHHNMPWMGKKGDPHSIADLLINKVSNHQAKPLSSICHHKPSPHNHFKPHEGDATWLWHDLFIQRSVPSFREGFQVIIIIKSTQKQGSVHQEGVVIVRGRVLVSMVHQLPV